MLANTIRKVLDVKLSGGIFGAKHMIVEAKETKSGVYKGLNVKIVKSGLFGMGKSTCQEETVSPVGKMKLDGVQIRPIHSGLLRIFVRDTEGDVTDTLFEVTC